LLIGSLELDFAFVRLRDPTGCQLVEVTRGNSWKAFPQWLQQHLAVFGQISRKEIVTNVGGVEESCCGIVIPIGVNSERGLVAAASDRSDFPDQIDQQLLSVAANNAATAFQNASLINELRRAQEALRAHEQELRKARDELEIKVAERTAELRRSEAYLAEAQRLTHTGSWADNVLTREMLHASEEHSRLHGFDPGGGAPSFEELHQRIHPDDRARVDETFQSASRAVTDVDVQYRIVLPDGTTRYVQAVGHPVFKPPGNVGDFVGFLMDVTERKRADKERETLRLVQADLAHVTRVTTMGELTASLAHEINQPLSGIVSNGSACLQWLAGDKPNLEEARQAAGRIVRDGKRAGEVIARIRTLTKKAAISTGKLDLNETIREVLALVRDEAKGKSIRIRTQYTDDLSPVLGDRVQLQQVVLNLVMNGIEAMTNAGDRRRELVIITRNIEGSHVQVTVQDSGTGLDPNLIERIFDPFYTTKAGGMGMGLSISRSIVHTHGGRLWATSGDAGADFSFTVPKYHEEASRAAI